MANASCSTPYRPWPVRAKTTLLCGSVLSAALSAMALSGGAEAQTCSAYTYTLTNGTTADATQVMSNFNTVRNCVNALQAAGDFVSPMFSGSPTAGSSTSGANYRQNAQIGWRDSYVIQRAGIQIAGIGTDGTNKLQLFTGSTTSDATARFTIDSAGNIGMGTASPDYIFHIQQNQNSTARMQLVNASTGTAALADLRISNGANYTTVTHYGTNRTTSGIFRQDGGLLYSPGAGGLTVATGASQPIYFAINESEKMRLDANGRLMIGVTSAVGSDSNTNEGIDLIKTYTWFAHNDSVYIQRPNGSNGNFLTFFKGGSLVGSVSVSGTTTNFNTTSDRRLKSNIASTPEPGSLIDAISVNQFDMGGTHYAYGFIAQQLHSVIGNAIPGAVTPGDDTDTIIEQWHVDYSKLVPLMMREIQSLRARTHNLEAVLDCLQARDVSRAHGVAADSGSCAATGAVHASESL